MADWPPFIDEPPLATDFVYIRRHGRQGSYSGSYTTSELEKDAKRIKSYLGENLDVFIYFNNDADGAAPRDALKLAAILHEQSQGSQHRGSQYR